MGVGGLPGCLVLRFAVVGFVKQRRFIVGFGRFLWLVQLRQLIIRQWQQRFILGF